MSQRNIQFWDEGRSRLEAVLSMFGMWGSVNFHFQPGLTSKNNVKLGAETSIGGSPIPRSRSTCYYFDPEYRFLVITEKDPCEGTVAVSSIYWAKCIAANEANFTGQISALRSILRQIFDFNKRIKSPD